MNMNRIRKLLVISSRSFLLVILALSILVTIFYLLCPVYDFEDSQPFNGNNIYNPYSDISVMNWKKASLHTHTTASDGHNELQEVQEAYSKFGYDILAITDHSKVILTGLSPDHEIPAYEHGLNLGFYHTVNIGIQTGSIYDYPFIATRSHKYNILKLMSDKADIVILAHPSRCLWLEPEDMKYLDHLQSLEVNWSDKDGKQDYLDAALSAGLPLYVVASDDCHDVNNPSKFARAATFINTPSTKYHDIKNTLQDGSSFGVVIPDLKDPEYKLKRNLNLPYLTGLNIARDTIECSFSEPCIIRVYGQNGKLRYTSEDDSAITIPFTREDTYLRFTSEFKDGVLLYTNPVYRYSGSNINRQSIASINYPKTYVQTLMLSTLIVLQFRLFVLVLLSILPRKVVDWSFKYRIFITIPGSRFVLAKIFQNKITMN
jgi:hypothetical protein